MAFFARWQSIDALRGLVMIIMALDHVRDFFHSSAFLFQPEDLTRTTPVLFFTRWITHLCAPTFMLTAGIGAFFYGAQPGRTPAQLSWFLLTRGLWLMVLEVTALRFAMTFHLLEGLVFLTVLWGLGLSMVCLALWSRLPPRTVMITSVAVIALHNLLDPIRAQQFGAFAWLWNLLHQIGVFSLGGVPVFVAYPLIPWVAVMAFGFSLGPVLRSGSEQRQRWLWRAGLAMILGFVLLRATNLYGDPLPWSVQPNGYTILSFLRTNKYPPSLLYLLMTLGPALMLLALFDRGAWSNRNPLLVFGRTPLFYFLGHFLLAHLLTIPFAWVRYGEAGFLWNPMPNMGGNPKFYPPGFGYDLGVTYAVWITVVILMYPLCVWFGEWKRRHKGAAWVSYL